MYIQSYAKALKKSSLNNVQKKEKKEAIQGLVAMGRKPKYVQKKRKKEKEKGKRKRKVEPGISQVLNLGAMGVNMVRADGISWRS